MSRILLATFVVLSVLGLTPADTADAIDHADPPDTPISPEELAAWAEFEQGMARLEGATRSERVEWIRGPLRRVLKELGWSQAFGDLATERMADLIRETKDDWVLWNLVGTATYAAHYACDDLNVEFAQHQNPSIRMIAADCADVGWVLDADKRAKSEPVPWVKAAFLRNVFGKRDDETVPEFCMDSIWSPDESLVTAALLCVTQFKPTDEQIDELERRATRGPIRFRQEAMRALGRVGVSPEWAEKQYRRNKEALLKADLLNLLFASESTQSKAAIIRHASDRDPRTASFALLLATYSLPADIAIPLASKRLGDPSELVVEAALTGIGTAMKYESSKLDPIVAGQIIAILRDSERDAILEEAVRALQFGNPDVAAQFLPLLDDPQVPNERLVSLIEVVGHFDWRKQAIEPLTALSTHQDPRVARASREALEVIDEELIVVELGCSLEPALDGDWRGLTPRRNRRSWRCSSSPDPGADETTTRISGGRVELVTRFQGTSLWAGVQLMDPDRHWLDAQPDCWVPISELTPLPHGAKVAASEISRDEFDVSADVAKRPAFATLVSAGAIDTIDESKHFVGVRWTYDEEKKRHLHALLSAWTLRDTPIGERALQIDAIRKAWDGRGDSSE